MVNVFDQSKYNRFKGMKPLGWFHWTNAELGNASRVPVGRTMRTFLDVYHINKLFECLNYNFHIGCINHGSGFFSKIITLIKLLQAQLVNDYLPVQLLL